MSNSIWCECPAVRLSAPALAHQASLPASQAEAGLADIFPRELIVTAADVPKGKPAPDIYLEAARRIGVSPAECRAYEDGESGLISAYLAGCHVVDVTHAHEYPTCEGLRAAKEAAAKERTWIVT